MNHSLFYAPTFTVDDSLISVLKRTLKSLINEQGGYVVFLVLSEYSFIRDFRVNEIQVF